MAPRALVFKGNTVLQIKIYTTMMEPSLHRQQEAVRMRNLGLKICFFLNDLWTFIGKVDQFSVKI